jgi:hypothetical protein
MSLFEDTAWDPNYKARMWAFVVIAAGFGLALYGGCSDLKSTIYSSSEPSTITAAQLAADGPGDNLHVFVTEYNTSTEAVGNEDVAWFLVLPKTRAEGQASIVLKTEGGNQYFGVFVPDDGLQGLVRNGSGTFNVDQRYALKKLGPVDFDNVWIIDHNRPPPPWWSFLLKVGGGLALIGVGAAVFLWSGDGD